MRRVPLVRLSISRFSKQEILDQESHKYFSSFGKRHQFKMAATQTTLPKGPCAFLGSSEIDAGGESDNLGVHRPAACRFWSRQTWVVKSDGANGIR